VGTTTLVRILLCIVFKGDNHNKDAKENSEKNNFNFFSKIKLKLLTLKSGAVLIITKFYNNFKKILNFFLLSKLFNIIFLFLKKIFSLNF
jgi:hypothetical protein